MGDIFSLIDEEVDANKFDKVSGEKGSALSTLIRESMKIDEDIATTEQYLKDLKFKKRKVNEEDIPALMQEMGMDSVTVDGNKVALRQFVHARIAEDKRDETHWLRSIGEGDIIKHDVVFPSKLDKIMLPDPSSRISRSRVWISAEDACTPTNFEGVGEGTHRIRKRDRL